MNYRAMIMGAIVTIGVVTILLVLASCATPTKEKPLTDEQWYDISKYFGEVTKENEVAE